MLLLSFEQYHQFIYEHKVVTGKAEFRMVEEVGNRIRRAVEDFVKENGKASLIQGYAWEFNLVKEDSANAFAMPGGKIVIYTGILPITQNENGFATVMGHEIAHVMGSAW